MHKFADYYSGQEIYRFDGSDERLLEKIAEAYTKVRGSEIDTTGYELIDTQIKRTIAEEERVVAHLTEDASIHFTLSNRQWEAFTQGVGALTSPDFGPSGVNLRFDDTADAPFDEEQSVLLNPRDQRGNGGQVLVDMGAVSRDSGNAVVDAGTEVWMFSAGPGQSRMRY